MIFAQAGLERTGMLSYLWRHAHPSTLFSQMHCLQHLHTFTGSPKARAALKEQPTPLCVQGMGVRLGLRCSRQRSRRHCNLSGLHPPSRIRNINTTITKSFLPPTAVETISNKTLACRIRKSLICSGLHRRQAVEEHLQGVWLFKLHEGSTISSR